MQVSLNYVWINAVRLAMPENSEGISCPIPKALTDNVAKISKENPYVKINIWCDFYGDGHHPARIMTALNPLRDAPQIAFKALDSIGTYRRHSLFKKSFKSFSDPNDAIWQQVDLARCLVIDHCLTNLGSDHALYADMDLDIDKDTLDQASKILSACGAVAAIPHAGGVIENQFFGVAKSGLNFLQDDLIPRVSNSIDGGLNGWNGHELAFNRLRQTCWQNTGQQITMVVKPMEGHSAVKKSYQNAVPTKPVQKTAFVFLPAGSPKLQAM